MGMHGVGKKFLFSFFGISALLFVPVYLLHDFEMGHNFVLLCHFDMYIFQLVTDCI